MSADIIDSLYDIRDVAWHKAQRLKKRIEKDTAELAVQTERWKTAERSAELLAASDLFGSASAQIPPESGLIRKELSGGC